MFSYLIKILLNLRNRSGLPPTSINASLNFLRRNPKMEAFKKVQFKTYGGTTLRVLRTAGQVSLVVEALLILYLAIGNRARIYGRTIDSLPTYYGNPAQSALSCSFTLPNPEVRQSPSHYFLIPYLRILTETRPIRNTEGSSTSSHSRTPRNYPICRSKLVSETIAITNALRNLMRCKT
jgi:hypothetical protein